MLGPGRLPSNALNHSDPSSILNLTVGEFLERLGSSDPAPGGGAAAAVAGAMGAALVQMTANLTIGRPKLADVEDIVLGCAMPEGEQGLNVARVVGLLAGLPVETSAVTVNPNRDTISANT